MNVVAQKICPTGLRSGRKTTTMKAINTTVLTGSSSEVNGIPQITHTSQHAGTATATAPMELKRTSENLDPLPLAG